MGIVLANWLSLVLLSSHFIILYFLPPRSEEGLNGSSLTLPLGFCGFAILMLYKVGVFDTVKWSK
jgi:hypothetical protein